MTAQRSEAVEVELIESLRLSGYQSDVMRVPESHDLFLGGGRGGGKSWALAQLILRHAAQHGAFASALYIRGSFTGMLDFDAILREVVPVAFPGASYASQSHLWRLPNGARIELGCLENAADLTRYQGRSFTMLCIDEAGEFVDLALAERLRANLRGPAGVPLRVALAANPGGPSHASLYRRFVAGRSPWLPFVEDASGHSFVYCPSTYRDNPYLDGDAYSRNLVASCAGDPELLRGWADGDWTISRGAFFASVLDERRVALDAQLWTPAAVARLRESPSEVSPAVAALPPSFFGFRPDRGERALRLYLAHDFGVAAPSVTFVVAESRGFVGPDARWYPPDSVLLLDEVATVEPGSLTKGLGFTVPQLSEEIRDLAQLWRMEPYGVADDAIFAKTGAAAGSIADEFRKNGVHFQRAGKRDRISGWQLMRSMLSAAGAPDKAGLYVSRGCSYFWQTVPTLPRSPRHVDDVDTRAADHAADAARYALARPAEAGVCSVVGILGA